MAYDLDKAIRKVKDFPKEGILFFDITSILTNQEAFSWCTDQLCSLIREKGIDAVAAVEARGFLFAAPAAEKMGIPLILVRKKGKLPGKTLSRSFQLEYGEDTIQVHVDDVPRGGKILVVDDLVATGGTLKAAAELIKEAGGQVQDIFCVVGLPFLPYSEVLKDYNVTTLINYDSEKI
ncbi:MAG: adenine phosphoribosyltransferase [Spirochaetales bacterium]|nr:adenine phosphoribosyltransferase [Spirochaetales bacterium]